MVPGMRIEDMGHKMGCNGVDNGKLWFDGALTSLLLLVCSAALFQTSVWAMTHSAVAWRFLSACRLDALAPQVAQSA